MTEILKAILIAGPGILAVIIQLLKYLLDRRWEHAESEITTKKINAEAEKLKAEAIDIFQKTLTTAANRIDDLEEQVVQIRNQHQQLLMDFNELSLNYMTLQRENKILKQRIIVLENGGPNHKNKGG